MSNGTMRMTGALFVADSFTAFSTRQRLVKSGEIVRTRCGDKLTKHVENEGLLKQMKTANNIKAV